eukprot:TRINITY_DN8428_c0_g2_i11.p1 TRINITY_DN8428_c0_g2~~TRINITY_DN8428_c0_g2_i11.p1  ORF type:complete len:171 (-),score=5.36 TRINITY_DN8428_c0_g2_i11:102-614(-)
MVWPAQVVVLKQLLLFAFLVQVLLKRYGRIFHCKLTHYELGEFRGKFSIERNAEFRVHLKNVAILHRPIPVALPLRSCHVLTEPFSTSPHKANIRVTSYISTALQNCSKVFLSGPWVAMNFLSFPSQLYGGCGITLMKLPLKYQLSHFSLFSPTATMLSSSKIERKRIQG